MKQYNNYKNTDMQYLGEIPEHWLAKKLKFTCKVTDGTHFSPPTTDSGMPYITVANVHNDTIDVVNANRISVEDYNNLVKQGCQPQKGDILLAKDGTVGRTAIVEDNNYVVLSSLGIIHPEEGLSSAFLKYSLDSTYLQEQMNAAMAGSALRRITIAKICELISLVPPLDEQQSIVSFLEDKVGQIDATIAEKEQMLEDLKNYRSAIISEAVTKGLDKNVEMKDSGIKWCREIPKHWNVQKIKFLSNMLSGTNLTSEQILEEGLYPVYGGNGIRGYYNDFNTEGTRVLVGRQGALCGNVNLASGKFWATEHAVVCHPIHYYDSGWFSALLETMNLNQYSQSAAQPGLSVEKIKNLSIPIPPITEQVRIGVFIKKQKELISSSLCEIESQINDLKSYKSALITEAVTGKIDLREWKS